MLSSFVWAVCPGQGTAIEFINGVDVKKDDAMASKKRLSEVVTAHSGVNPGCVVVNYSYNTNEPYFIDFLEAGLEKAELLSGDSSDFWKQYFRTVPALDWFNNLVVETLFVPINGAIGLGEYALGDQTLEHVAKYVEHTAPTTVGGQRKRLILVGHSQGSAVAVLERKALSVSDQANAFVVSASALTVPEPEHDRYTTLDKDNLASVIFAEFGAPLPNIPLESTTKCDNSNVKWLCHAFKETYLNIPESRNKIANDIVSFLPTQPLPSSILYDQTSLSVDAWNAGGANLSPILLGGIPSTLEGTFQGSFSGSGYGLSDNFVAIINNTVTGKIVAVSTPQNVNILGCTPFNPVYLTWTFSQWSADITTEFVVGGTLGLSFRPENLGTYAVGTTLTGAWGGGVPLNYSTGAGWVATVKINGGTSL